MVSGAVAVLAAEVVDMDPRRKLHLMISCTQKHFLPFQMRSTVACQGFWPGRSMSCGVMHPRYLTAV